MKKDTLKQVSLDLSNIHTNVRKIQEDLENAMANIDSTIYSMNDLMACYKKVENLSDDMKKIRFKTAKLRK